MRKLSLGTTALLIAVFGAWTITAPPAAAATPKCNGKTATKWLTTPGTLDGTEGPDVLVGTNGIDTINGLEGDDVICGLGGDDTIDAGSGNDVVKGGDGFDWIHTEGASTPDDDTYDGEGGNDEITDDTGFNVAKGGSGEDKIDVTGKAYGESGDDFLVSATETSEGAGNAYADGGSGSDGCLVRICAFGDILFGVVANGGTADGGSGADEVAVTGSGSTAKGGSGEDFVNSSDLDNQFLDCGAGYDSYTSSSGDTQRRCENGVV
jgi:Ca2+-binding RTX toxin-like protein